MRPSSAAVSPLARRSRTSASVNASDKAALSGVMMSAGTGVSPLAESTTVPFEFGDTVGTGASFTRSTVIVDVARVTPAGSVTSNPKLRGPFVLS